MTDHDTVGGESARFVSDGLVLQLENGRSVRPRLRRPGENESWVVTFSSPEEREIGLGPEVDDTRVILSLSPSKAVFTQDGERIYHYEWVGGLYCEREEQVFDYETGEVTCPYCGEGFTVPESDK